MTLSPSTKTVQEVLTWVKRQFGDESGVQITDSDILRWLNMAQLEIAKTTKCIQKISTGPVTKGVYQYSLPTEDSLEIVSLSINGAPVKGIEFQYADSYIMENDPGRVSTGNPMYWWRFSNQLFFWPTPDKTNATAMTIYHIGIPPQVLSPSDPLGLPDRYFEAIIMFCMTKAYELDEDYQAAAGARQQYGERVGETFEDDIRGENLFYPSITVLDDSSGWGNY